MSNVVKTLTQTLTRKDIEELYPLTQDRSKRWYVNPNSLQFVEEIINLWFEKQGFDFWQNPFPEVTEWVLDKENTTVTFTYIQE